MSAQSITGARAFELRPQHEQLLVESRDLTASLQTQLVPWIRPEPASHVTKAYYKLDSLRQVLLHRIVDLADSANALAEEGRILPAIVLTRSLIETVSALYYARKKARDAADKGALSAFDDDVMRLLLGSKSPSPGREEKAVNVLTMVDHIAKEVDLFRVSYDEMCEFAHPNWSGAFGSYGQIQDDGTTIVLSLPQSLERGLSRS